MSRSPSPMIRRATKTYGRRRDTSEHDISFDAANTSIDSRDDSNSSVSIALDHDFPPDSDDIDASNTSSLSLQAEDADASDASSDEEVAGDHGRFEFSWKAKLKQIDDGDFEPVAESKAEVHRRLLSEAAPTRPASPVDPAHADIFGGTLSSLTSSGPSESSEIIHVRAPRRISAPTSEPGSDGAVRPSTPQSSPRDPINTPQTQSSPTPPTSIEMLSKKGKGKQRDAKASSLDAEERVASSSKMTTAQPRRGASGASKRVKAPTKKDRIETQKVTARITAEQPISIPRVQQNKYRLNDFLDRLKPVLAVRERTPPIPSTPESIQPFTSSPSPRPNHHCASSSKATIRQDDSFAPNGLLDGGAQLSDGSDDTFPDVSEFGQQLRKKRGEEERLRQLQRTKLQLLEQQKVAPAHPVDDSDDDLVIVDDPKSVAKEEAQKRRVMTAQGAHLSRGRQRQLALAKASARTMVLPSDEEEARHLLEVAAASTFAAPGMKDVEKVAITDPATLNKLLLQQDNKLKEKIIHEKEEDWKRRGGKVKEQPGERAEVMTDMQLLKEILKKRTATSDQPIDAEMVDDSEDEDYRPPAEDVEQDSDRSEPSDAKDENAIPSPGRGDLGEQADDEGDDEDQPMGPPPRRLHANPRRRPIAAVVSDDDEDAENQPLRASRSLVRDTPFGRPSRSPQADDMDVRGHTLVHRSSLSSMGERTEDGTDKENDARLSFDRGEDKENTAVALQTPGLSLRLSRGLSSLFEPSLEGSPAGRSITDGVRSPLKDLPADDEDGDDPFVLKTSPTPLRLSTPVRNVARETTPMDLGEGSGLLEPAFSPKGKGKARARSPSPSPLAEGLLIGGGGGLSQFFSQEHSGSGFEKLKAAQRDDDISLTMDHGLQPVLEVDQSLAKKADEIFEREQELALLELQATRLDTKPELFVDENGFLTQTRPQFRSPLVTMTPSQLMPSSRIVTPASLLSSVRKPLASLLAQDPNDDEELSETPLRRLRRRGGSPTPDRRPSPSRPKPKNAFDILGRGLNSTKPKKPKHSAFIEGEAEESDDDAAFGFGVKPKGDDDDEEEDGEDQDRHLEELVDDKEMDDKTLAEEKVLEKVREHQEQDDKALEKVHLAAVQGELRARRRARGFDLADSDSESDEEARAVRARAKKRRLKNDSIDALAKHEETRAFAKEYNAGMEDDEDEVIPSKGDDDMVVDQPEAASEEEQEVVSAAKLRDQLREAARQREAMEVFDPADVNWLEDAVDSADEMDTKVSVREVAADAVAPRGSIPTNPPQDKSSRFSADDLSRLTRWAKAEQSSRTAGVVGRNTGASAAVTGHAKSKASNGSFKPSRASAASSSSQGGKPGTKVTKTASVLSAVSSRRDKFTN